MIEPALTQRLHAMVREYLQVPPNEQLRVDADGDLDGGVVHRLGQGLGLALQLQDGFAHLRPAAQGRDAQQCAHQGQASP
mgnify:CR=1 FL=1